MAKKKVIEQNYLENVPVHSQSITWELDGDDAVVLQVENKGMFNRIAQKLFKKPKVSFIHLDDLGSFVWKLIDGQKSIIDIGKEVEQHFGESANPLYERLATYFQMLESYNFVTFK